MEARLARCAVLVAALSSLGASYRTTNFIVEAPTPQLAEQIGQAAENYRRDLAIEWLGQAIPSWAQPCPITAHVGDTLGAGGATSFCVRARRSLRLADDHPRLAGAHSRFGAAARSDSYDLRHPFSPAAAAVGRRGCLHDGRARQRARQAAGRC